MSSNKVFVIGLDGMDPSLTKKFLTEGIMPNVQKFIERGCSTREDLVMQGASPNHYPANVDIYGYRYLPGYSRHHLFLESGSIQSLDTMVYALGLPQYVNPNHCGMSFAEAGKKTLVWHWPGSSWPASC